MVCMGHASRPGGASHLRGPMHSGRRAALAAPRRAMQARAYHGARGPCHTGAAIPAHACWPARRTTGRQGPCAAGRCRRGVQTGHFRGGVPWGRTHLAAPHGRAETPVWATVFVDQNWLCESAGRFPAIRGRQYMGRDPRLTPHARRRRMRLPPVVRRGRLINDLDRNAPNQSMRTGDIPGGGSDAHRGFGPCRGEYP